MKLNEMKQKIEHDWVARFYKENHFMLVQSMKTYSNISRLRIRVKIYGGTLMLIIRDFVNGFDVVFFAK